MENTQISKTIMINYDEFGDKTELLRNHIHGTIQDQITVFLEFLKGCGYSIETIKRMEEALEEI